MAKKPSTVPDNGFLQDILAHPEDDTPRLVYADFLDEHEQPHRAELIRLQVRLAKLSESVRRHGGDFESYLAEREPKSGKLPTYLVKVREGNEESVRYFHDQREVRKFHEDNLDLNQFDT